MEFTKPIKKFFNKFTKKQKKIISFVLFFLVLAEYSSLIIFKEGNSFSVSGEGDNLKEEEKHTFKKSSFSGVPCANAKKRAIGVVLAEYPETAPLSGVSEADIVIEGPVASSMGVNRAFSIFQCASPREIGSIRSVRPYIADLSLGFDAVLTSFGGASRAIDRVKSIGVDWLDGRVNPSGVFFRKTNIPAPHNAFSSLGGLRKAAESMGMRKVDRFEGYKFLEEDKIIYSKKSQLVKIDYMYPVKYVYNQKTGDYARFWNGSEMVDRNTGKQVFSKNLVIMKASIGVFSPGVVNVDIAGNGEAKIFKGGEEIKGTWRKEGSSAKLSFLNKEKEEIKFIPGKIWIHIVSEF